MMGEATPARGASQERTRGSGSGNSGHLQNFDWRRQPLGVRIWRLLNLPDHIHPLDDPPKGRKSLAIGVAPPPKSSEG